MKLCCSYRKNTNRTKMQILCPIYESSALFGPNLALIVKWISCYCTPLDPYSNTSKVSDIEWIREKLKLIFFCV